MKILITGASRGLGKFLVEKFASEGNQVFGTYSKTMVEDVENISFRKVDITKEKEVEDWVTSIQFQPTNEVVLINCAGINYNAFIHKSDSERWRKVIETNLIGTYHCIKHVLKNIRKQTTKGTIVNISSVVSQIGVMGTSAYSASKAALWGLTKTVALENAANDITCNVLNLGYFNIGMIDEVPEEMRKSLLSRIPIPKFGDPEDVFSTIQYLIKTRYITGTSLDINGGLF
jgi:NAD(P)-dependent dehydrogenase (short-subunit alcohol dehydrogenase family)